MNLLPVIFSMLLQVNDSTSPDPRLTAAYHEQENLVELRWQLAGNDITGCILQSSADLVHWRDIHQIQRKNFSKKKLEKYSDRNFQKNLTHYRIKVITINGIAYSQPITVVIGTPKNNWTIYPVPVRDVLNIQYKGSQAITGVVGIIIRNISGYVLIRRRYSSLSRNISIPVDNLGRGIYEIMIMVNNENVWSSRFTK